MKKILLLLLAVGSIVSSCRKDDATSQYPNSGVDQEILSRSKYGDYNTATFSFEYATRDDRELTLNDWDIQYGNRGETDDIMVNMVTDDRSSIADLGVVDFNSIKNIPADAQFREEVVADTNHVYIVHTVDSKTDMYAKFVITSMKPNDWIRIDWRRSEDGVRFDD